MERTIKEITYDAAMELSYRFGRTILVGTASDDCYYCNIKKYGETLDETIKAWKNYHDGEPHFFIYNRTLLTDKTI